MDEQGDTNQFIPICMHKFCTSPEKNEKTTQKKITVVQAITYHPEFFMRSIKYPGFTKADLKFTWGNILDPNQHGVMLLVLDSVLNSDVNFWNCFKALNYRELSVGETLHIICFLLHMSKSTLYTNYP